MLTRLTRMGRLRAAVTLALAYALCVLAPPVALAFMESGADAHYLTARYEHRAVSIQSHDVHAQADRAVAHVHDDGATHRHDGHHGSGKNEDDGNAIANCCGIFCLSAIPMSPAPDVPPTARIVSLISAIDLGIAGRDPDRIDRPPIVLLPH